MKKLLSILFVVVAFVATSCSSGDDGPSAPPKIDVTKLYGEWKQMPEQNSDGTYNDEEYYHSLVVSDNLTFTGLWNEGYDKDSDDGRYEYSRVSGRIVVDGDKLALHQNFYDEDGEFDETEIMDGLEVIALTDDILVVRESYTNNGFVYAYRDYGFYREHAADMLPTLGYVCNLQSAEIRVYDSSGNIVNGNVSCDYAGCRKTFTVKVYVRTFDGTDHEFKDVYLSVSEDYTDKFVNVSNIIGTSNEVNVNIEQNYDSYSRSNTIRIWTYGVADGYFFPEKTITIYQSGKPSSGDNTGGSTGGGSSSGGNSGGNTGGSSGSSSSSDKYFIKTVTTCEILQVSNNVTINSSSKTMYLYQSPTGSYYLKTSKSSDNMYMVTGNVSSYVYSGDHSKKISVSKWDYCGKRYVGLSTYYYFFNM